MGGNLRKGKEGGEEGVKKALHTSHTHTVGEQILVILEGFFRLVS